jgi:hypothetical protein
MPPKPPAIVNLKLRIRESLRRKIEVAAKKNDTSLNAEFVKRVEASFQHEEAVELSAIVAEANETFGKIDWDAYREFNKRHDLFRAAIALLAQVSQLPEEIRNAAALTEAALTCAKAINETAKAIEKVVSPKPLLA